MTEHIYIDGPTLVDMLTAMTGINNCDHCDAGPAIRIYDIDRWDLVHVHDIKCPASNYSQRHEAHAA